MTPRDGRPDAWVLPSKRVHKVMDKRPWRVGNDGDHVEPATGKTWPFDRQVCVGKPSQTDLLAIVNPLGRIDEVTGPAGLDLHEDEDRPIGCDNIELALLDPPVAGQDAKAPRLEMPGRRLLAQMLQLPFLIPCIESTASGMCSSERPSKCKDKEGM